MANTLHFYILSIKSKEMGNIIGFTNNILWWFVHLWKLIPPINFQEI
jgi:hypothetical protein